MIDAYLEKSPAAMKVPVFLEEAGLEYRTIHVSVARGQQHGKEFRAISPNDKVPAIVDHQPADHGSPLEVFESGAILFYLADKTGRFIPADPRDRAKVMQWLFWQAAGLSPMSGQAVHFTLYKKDDAYAQDRYYREVNRLYGVLNKRLADREFITGVYTIADMAAYPWTVLHKWTGQTLDDFPHLKRWQETIAQRPAVIRAYERADRDMPEVKTSPEEFRQHMFGHTAKSLGLI